MWCVCFVCRYVATDVPSDLLVKVGGVCFHLHKVVKFLLNTNGSIILLVAPKFKVNYY